MVESWRTQLRFDPITVLLSSDNKAIRHFVISDLIGKLEPEDALWQMPQVAKIIYRQQEDGSWKYRGGRSHVRSRMDYNQLETYRMLGQLVELYGLTKEHPAIRRAASFLFGCQTEEGDFRGIYRNQYSPNYTAAIAELLIKVGYEGDRRIDRVFDWLLSIRQDDGGWAIPLRTASDKVTLRALQNPRPIRPNSTKTSSHMVTGIVLRAFAAHSKRRKSEEAKVAGELLASRFFQPDRYPDRRDAAYWTRFTFPFWFTDLISALDSLSQLGFASDDLRIMKGINWLVHEQRRNGLWKLNLLKDKSIEDMPLWISLAFCKVMRRLHP
jgi:squalene cyclase